MPCRYIHSPFSTCRLTDFDHSEIYETDAGVADHFQMSESSWREFPALVITRRSSVQI